MTFKQALIGILAGILVGTAFVSAQEENVDTDTQKAAIEARGKGENTKEATKRKKKDKRGRKARGDWDGTFNMDKIAQRMLEKKKAKLNVTDEEWIVIEPLLKKVTTLLNQNRMTGMGGVREMKMIQRYLGEDAEEKLKEIPGYNESQALQEVLEQESPDVELLKAKIAAIRAAKTASQDKLKAARENLRIVLTAEQEAQLILDGTLD